MPLAYYAAYFTIRAKAFDAEFMINGKAKAKAKMDEITSLGNNAAPKDKDMYDDLELVYEMYERGYEFLPIDLYKSHSTKFQIEDGKIRPPLNSIPGLGTVAAESIEEAKKGGEFMCIDELQQRSKIGKSVVELLYRDCGTPQLNITPSFSDTTAALSSLTVNVPLIPLSADRLIEEILICPISSDLREKRMIPHKFLNERSLLVDTALIGKFSTLSST
jgi:hypothetical protein